MMDKRMTRQLASILLVIAVILISINGLNPKGESAEPQPPKKGYIEVKKTDYSQLEKEAGHWKHKYEELNGKSKEQAKATKEDKKVEKVMHLNINGGMTSKEVSKQMEKAGVIKSANEFNDYLAGKDWQQSIQIGSYELTSEMGLQEIAETITGNRSSKE